MSATLTTDPGPTKFCNEIGAQIPHPNTQQKRCQISMIPFCYPVLDLARFLRDFADRMMILEGVKKLKNHGADTGEGNSAIHN